MSTLDPAVAAIRLAVRRELAALPDRADVMVACSGGADSLALLSATVFEARHRAIGVIGAVVDHGLQDGSAAHTARVVQQMTALGVDRTASVRVEVDSGPAGVEAGARAARYAALGRLCERFRASCVLLGHTLDDQAETVLLGLSRGSGDRSIAGMRHHFEREGTAYVRPMLAITRAQTEAACAALGVSWWSDPQNADQRFARARIRHTLMPMLERELGPGIAAALARTADAVRSDVDVLDEQADRIAADAKGPTGWDLTALRPLPEALQSRVLRTAALSSGALGSELARQHVLALCGLVNGPDKHLRIRLPGHLTAYREGDLLCFRPTLP